MKNGDNSAECKAIKTIDAAISSSLNFEVSSKFLSTLEPPECVTFVTVAYTLNANLAGEEEGPKFAPVVAVQYIEQFHLLYERVLS